MAQRESDINWDCYIDPPYPDDREIDEIERQIHSDFIEMEDEEIEALLKTEPKNYRGKPYNVD